MGLIDSLVSAVTGTINIVVLSTVISAIWIQFVVLDNTDIFTLGGVTKLIIGLLPLFYAIAVIKKMFKETEEERQQISNFRGNP